MAKSTFTLCACATLIGTFCFGVEIDTANRNATRQFFFDHFINSSQTSMEWDGNHSACDAGTTSSEYRGDILQQINFFRAMAGVPAEIAFADEFNEKAQEAALMMSANRRLDHFPNAGWTCYTEDGAEAARSSNLALGVAGPNAIAGYMEDPGPGNYAVGHRRWILHPQTERMGTGDVPRVGVYPPANTLWVFDGNTFAPRPETRDPFVAWPPAGFVPNQVVYPRWSFGVAKADFSSATVRMSTGDTEIDVDVAQVETGFGENTVVWVPERPFRDWVDGKQDTTYAINIDNVILDGVAQSYGYEVSVFDPSQAPQIRGDFNGDGRLTAVDIDELSRQVRTGTNDVTFDLTADGKVDQDDRVVWVEDVKQTYFGDANLDGVFGTSDLVDVFVAAKYERPGVTATWSTGDWDGDAYFTSADFVLSFVSGCYENSCGPRPRPSLFVPEPSSAIGLLLSMIAICNRWRARHQIRRAA